uniref:TBC/LysM-associated domain containing 2 n=1 Tax=Aquila chrysaetos chrysaetos TaxID=223781 RepID=A0A663DYS4_AQUCH
MQWWYDLAGYQGHGTAQQGCWEQQAARSWAGGSAKCPSLWPLGLFTQPLDGTHPMQDEFRDAAPSDPAEMLTSTCPQPDQDEELPVGCGELAREGQPGWEGLGPHLPPPRLTQQPWHLLCCTRQDSFSLRTLYQFRGQLGSPTLLLIRDTEAQPGPPQPSWETFIFSFSPELKVFRWTGRNNFFVKGDIDLLMIGGGSKFGLWLDRDLHYSGSHPCETFDNETLSPWEEFCVQDLEVWGLA